MTTRSYPTRSHPTSSYGDQLPIGAVVGEYVVDGWAASGGMATVYVAHHPTIGKKAAVKVISRELANDPVCVERFLQEARSAGQITHPNVVEVFGFGTLGDGRSYSIMEWLEGETLGQRMERGLTIAEGCEILVQVCDALAATHERGIIHRDLKPENIFLERVQGGRTIVKLIDFGIAKLVAPPTNGTRLTAEHSTLGTAEYLSPEQATGRPILPPSDVYSLGVVAYEMFVGGLPFAGDTPIEIMYQHIHAEPPAPSTRGKRFPRALDDLLWAMLEKDPTLRPELWAVRAALVAMPDELLRHAAAGSPSGPIESIAGEAIASNDAVLAPEHLEDDDDDVEPPPTAHTLKRALVASPRARHMRNLGIAASGAVLVALLLPTLRPRELAPTDKGTFVAEAAATTVAAAAEPTVAPTPPPAPRVLAVHTNVGNAHFVLDGRTIADLAASAKLTLPDDQTHTLEISAPGYKPVAQKVSVLPGQTLDVAVRLQRKFVAPQKSARRSNYIIDSTGAVR